MSCRRFLLCLALLLLVVPLADGQSFLFNRSDFATGIYPAESQWRISMETAGWMLR